MMTESPAFLEGTEALPGVDGRHSRGDRTRQALLDAAFFEIHRHGFQATSLNEIINRAGCTKGSLYHHFIDKHSLGLAAVAEHVGGHIRTSWIVPLAETDDPLTAIHDIVERYASGEVELDPRLGCPFQNLTQEMAGIDKDFQDYFRTLFSEWRGAIAAALARGQEMGTVRTNIDAVDAATLIVSTHQGVVSMIKATQDLGVGRSAATAFFDYLDSLRP